MPGSLRLVLRTATDLLIGCSLFVIFALAISAYDRHARGMHHLGLVTVSLSAGELLKFSLDDSPLLAAAAVSTAVPLPKSDAFITPDRPGRGTAMLLLACVFSLVVAFNLAFVRHLRRVYASPR